MPCAASEATNPTPPCFGCLWRQTISGRGSASKEGSHARGRPVIRLDRRVARGAELEVPRESLAPAGEDEYYVFQLVGLRVEEEGGDELGTVTDVIPGVANDVLELDSGLALPMVEDCVRVVDLANGRIVVSPGFAGRTS